MALRFAVLGLLSKEEQSGYDLAHTFTETISHFWHAHHTQIYRELQKLEAEGLVCHRLVEQQERPDKKMYQVTSDGMQALMQWLSESPKPPKMKNEALLRVSLFHLLSPDQAIAFLAQSREWHLRALGEMSAWQQAHFGEDAQPDPQRVGEQLTVDFGLRAVKSWVEWCEYGMQLFARLKAQDDSAVQ